MPLDPAVQHNGGVPVGRQLGGQFQWRAVATVIVKIEVVQVVARRCLVVGVLLSPIIALAQVGNYGDTGRLEVAEPRKISTVLGNAGCGTSMYASKNSAWLRPSATTLGVAVVGVRLGSWGIVAAAFLGVHLPRCGGLTPAGIIEKNQTPLRARGKHYSVAKMRPFIRYTSPVSYLHSSMASSP